MGKHQNPFIWSFLLTKIRLRKEIAESMDCARTSRGLIVRESYNVLPTHGQNSSQKFKIKLLKMIFDKIKAPVLVTDYIIQYNKSVAE